MYYWALLNNIVVRCRFQVFVFLPAVWSEPAASLLQQVSGLAERLDTVQDCVVTAVAGDSPGSTLQWLQREGGNTACRVLPDTGGSLARRFGVYEAETGEAVRCVVITDNMGVVLEVVGSSLTDSELADYTVGLVARLVDKRKRAVDPAYRQQQERLEQSAGLETAVKVVTRLVKSNRPDNI